MLILFGYSVNAHSSRIEVSRISAFDQTVIDLKMRTDFIHAITFTSTVVPLFVNKSYSFHFTSMQAIFISKKNGSRILILVWGKRFYNSNFNQFQANYPTEIFNFIINFAGPRGAEELRLVNQDCNKRVKGYEQTQKTTVEIIIRDSKPDDEIKYTDENGGIIFGNDYLGDANDPQPDNTNEASRKEYKDGPNEQYCVEMRSTDDTINWENIVANSSRIKILKLYIICDLLEDSLLNKLSTIIQGSREGLNELKLGFITDDMNNSLNIFNGESKFIKLTELGLDCCELSLHEQGKCLPEVKSLKVHGMRFEMLPTCEMLNQFYADGFIPQYYDNDIQNVQSTQMLNCLDTYLSTHSKIDNLTLIGECAQFRDNDGKWTRTMDFLIDLPTIIPHFPSKLEQLYIADVVSHRARLAWLLRAYKNLRHALCAEMSRKNAIDLIKGAVYARRFLYFSNLTVKPTLYTTEAKYITDKYKRIGVAIRLSSDAPMLEKAIGGKNTSNSQPLCGTKMIFLLWPRY